MLLVGSRSRDARHALGDHLEIAVRQILVFSLHPVNISAAGDYVLHHSVTLMHRELMGIKVGHCSLRSLLKISLRQLSHLLRIVPFKLSGA